MALNTNTRFGPALDNFLKGQIARFQGAVYPQGKYPCDDPYAPTPQCTLTLPVGPPDFSRSNRYHEFALYAQDSFRITPRFTVNAGLRWEYFGIQHNKDPKKDSNYYDASQGNSGSRSGAGTCSWRRTARSAGCG
jgi:outer membrane receptor protein involved in Fe transport